MPILHPSITVLLASCRPILDFPEIQFRNDCWQPASRGNSGKTHSASIDASPGEMWMVASRGIRWLKAKNFSECARDELARGGVRTIRFFDGRPVVLTGEKGAGFLADLIEIPLGRFFRCRAGRRAPEDILPRKIFSISAG